MQQDLYLYSLWDSIIFYIIQIITFLSNNYELYPTLNLKSFAYILLFNQRDLFVSNKTQI